MYSDARALTWEGLCSHRVRLVLSEKDIAAEIVDINDAEINEDLMQLNPAGTCPVLVDRELALYDTRVINDYLDERYPHPPFMPIDPVSRARSRLALYRIESEWYTLLPESPHQTLSAEEAKNALTESLTASSEVFAAMPFFLGEEYSILDATIAPLLWRLPAYGIWLA
jgi:RNA polymerase-associated protein